uniref:C2H2-type domain-containing protein n=1 Tax=Panagrolaimus sp. JU765 TaxID=591449 RepID=A0AC34Q4Y6_9BILA
MTTTGNLRCITCPNETYQTREDLEAHVASSHFHYFPYECEQCRYANFPTEWALRYHYQSVHNETTFYIRYQMSPELLQKRGEMESFINQCLSECDDVSTPSQRNLAFSIDSIFDNHQSTNSISSTEPNFSVPYLGVKPFSIDSIFDNHQSTNSISSTEPSFTVPYLGVKRPANNDIGEPEKKVKKRGKDADRGHTVCQGCRRIIANQSTSMMYHTNFSHLTLPVFTCLPCNRVWTAVSRGDTLKHIRKYHRGDESVIIDRKKEFIDEIKKKCDELFPNRPKRVIHMEGDDEPDNEFHEDIQDDDFDENDTKPEIISEFSATSTVS